MNAPNIPQKRNVGWYGFKPSLPDKRDYKFRLVHRSAMEQPLPEKVDLSPKMPPCLDQGNLGSCTAHALAGAYVWLEIQEKLTQQFTPSRLFIYYNERAIEGTVPVDSGASLRDGIESLVKQGVCNENLWNYNMNIVYNTPSQDAYSAAGNHKVEQYSGLDTLDEMKACLASGFPFVLGITVYDYFESNEITHTGILNMPQSSEKVQGGHAVLAVGYDEVTQRFKIRNSWGTDWGQNGYFTIPYEYVGDPDLTSDVWTMRKLADVLPVVPDPPQPSNYHIK